MAAGGVRMGADGGLCICEITRPPRSLTNLLLCNEYKPRDATAPKMQAEEKRNNRRILFKFYNNGIILAVRRFGMGWVGVGRRAIPLSIH